MDLTIIIPTKNRFKFIEKVIKYYSSLEFKGDLLIVDSSENSIFEEQSKLFNKYKNLNILHYYSPYTTILAAKEHLDKIKKNYVTLTGDDDYQILSGIKDAINYLEKNTNINAIRGNSYLFDIISNSKVNKIYDYNGNEYLDNNIIDRILKFFEHPRSVCSNIWKSTSFKNALKEFLKFDEIKDCPDRYFYDEILFTSVLVANNKIKRINSDQFVMTLNSQRLKDRKWEVLNYNNLIKSIEFTSKKLFDILSRNQKNVLSTDKQIILKGIEKFIFNKYLPALKRSNGSKKSFRKTLIRIFKIIKIYNLLKKVKNLFHKETITYNIDNLKEDINFKQVFKNIEN
tara:strand:- start:2405 stop:3433 length:1029 start_codon:yes stop_codon:yes gene_type:complete